MKKVLVAGYTTRHVAASAARAGYEVYAIDHFCDQDLIWCTKDHLAFDEIDELPFAISDMLGEYDIDYVVTTSGAELLDVKNRLGTQVSIAERFMDKGKTQEFFERIGVPVPRRLGYGQYPAMMKTLSGAGGWRNAVVHSDAERKEWEEFVDHVPSMAQEPSLVSRQVYPVLGRGTLHRPLCKRADPRGGDECAFAFSGSLTPCGIHLQTHDGTREKIVAEAAA